MTLSTLKNIHKNAVFVFFFFHFHFFFQLICARVDAFITKLETLFIKIHFKKCLMRKKCFTGFRLQVMGQWLARLDVLHSDREFDRREKS